MVIEYLTKIEKIDSIIIWGRSMGGATAILYLGHNEPHPKVTTLILDSPFDDYQTSLGKVFRDTYSCDEKINDIVINKVKKLLNVDLTTDLIPLNHVHKVKIPTLFIHGERDTLVFPECSKKLLEKCGSSKKELFLFNGTHNSSRHIGGAFEKCF